MKRKINLSILTLDEVKSGVRELFDALNEQHARLHGDSCDGNSWTLCIICENSPLHEDYKNLETELDARLNPITIESAWEQFNQAWNDETAPIDACEQTGERLWNFLK